jgi:hypothetical protein
MPTRDELYPSKWLKASDVDTPITATIDRCPIESVGQGTKAERKPVLYFRDGVKPCVLNKTNFDMLVTLTGYDDCDHWGGTVVELFAVDVTGPNGPTRGVRIRRPRHRAGARAALPPQRLTPVVPPDDDIDATMQPLPDAEVL